MPINQKHYYLPQLIEYFGVDNVEFGVKHYADPNADPAQSRDRVSVHKSSKSGTWSYLRSQNAVGCDVYMRPVFDIEPAFLLLDDLSAAQIAIHRERPGRLIIKTSPGNYQCWVHFAAYLSNAEKSYLIRKCAADPGATPQHRWGRAPGFSNRKPKHISPSIKYADGRVTWTQFILATPGLAAVPEFPADINKSTVAPASTPTSPSTIYIDPSQLDLPEAPPGAVGLAQSHYRHAAAHGATDTSKIDFALAGRLIQRYTPSEAAATLLAVSPNIQQRKSNRPGGAAAYAVLVINNAINRSVNPR